MPIGSTLIQQNQTRKGLFSPAFRRKCPALVASLLLGFLLQPRVAKGTDSFRLFAPSSQVQHMKAAFQPVAARLQSDQKISVTWIASRGAALPAKTLKAQSDSTGPILWFGWTEEYIARLYSKYKNRFQPQWVRDDTTFRPVAGVPAGVIELGAGWHQSTPDGPVTLSLPRRLATMSIISMAIVSSSSGPRGRPNADLIRGFTRILFATPQGRQTLRALTVLPALPSSGPNDVTILLQPVRNDDECDCEDSMASPQLCDPDGSFPRSMVGLERRNNRVLAPSYSPSRAGVRNDDCDACDEQRGYWYKVARGVVANLYAKARASSQGEWTRHFNELYSRHGRGDIVFILTCDPD